MFRIVVADHPVAPVDQLVDVGVGHVEHFGENTDREVGGDLVDEFELALREGGVEGAGGQAAQEGLVAGDGAGSELTLHEAAKRAVTNTVGLEHRLAGLDLLVVELFEVDRAALAGERLGVTEHGDDVVVAGERPEAVVGCWLF